MPLEIQFERVYPDEASLFWRGVRIIDKDEFELYLRGPVKSRVEDESFLSELAGDLAALSTSDMATATLSTLLSSAPDPLDWEIGEALAECLLRDEVGATWPWNENRDRKTPRASLPGADVVGFLGEGDDTVFLFGEVKTSSDSNNPPGVMNGRSGLANQIENLTTEVGIHNSLLIWLAARCKGTEYWEKYETACRRYLQSEGKDVALVGVLLRDTPPHQDDLRTRGEALEAKGASMPKIRLDAWYAPHLISDWVQLVVSE